MPAAPLLARDRIGPFIDDRVKAVALPGDMTLHRSSFPGGDGHRPLEESVEARGPSFTARNHPISPNKRPLEVVIERMRVAGVWAHQDETSSAASGRWPSSSGWIGFEIQLWGPGGGVRDPFQIAKPSTEEFQV
jgi:hypothetical protein